MYPPSSPHAEMQCQFFQKNSRISYGDCPWASSCFTFSFVFLLVFLWETSFTGISLVDLNRSQETGPNRRGNSTEHFEALPSTEMLVSCFLRALLLTEESAVFSVDPTRVSKVSTPCVQFLGILSHRYCNNGHILIPIEFRLSFVIKSVHRVLPSLILFTYQFWASQSELSASLSFAFRPRSGEQAVTGRV